MSCVTLSPYKNSGYVPPVSVKASQRSQSDIISAYTPSYTLDLGEIEVLALARTLIDPLVLLDDEIARSEARRLNLKISGTLGILVQGV
jgi:predicted nucleic acid-binding protein